MLPSNTAQYDKSVSLPILAHNSSIWRRHIIAMHNAHANLKTSSPVPETIFGHYSVPQYLEEINHSYA